MTEKQLLTSVCQYGGGCTSVKHLCKAQHLELYWTVVLKIRHTAEPKTFTCNYKTTSH